MANEWELEAWIAEVQDPASIPATLPTDPGNVVMLFGYLGIAQQDTVPHTVPTAYRLYRTPQLNEYLIIIATDILHVTKVDETFSPYGGSLVFVKPTAKIRYVYTESMQAQASFLQGHFTNGGPAAPYSGGGGGGGEGGGEASYACGGTSFACGASFACGGVSFACGGVSFACGGASFGCP